MSSSIPSASRFTPVPGHPGIARRDGQYVVRSPHRKGRPSTFRTLKAALAEQGLRRAGAAAASSEPFADFAPRWIAHYQGRNSGGLDETTRAAYRDAIDRLAVPFFKRKPIAKIDKPLMKAYIKHLRDEHSLSVASIQKYVAPLRAMFAECVEDKVLPDNPATVRIVGKVKPQSDKPRKPKALAPELLAPLLAELEQGKRDLLMVLAFTGLRIAEVCGLQWRDLAHDDVGRPVLRVERQWTDGRYKDHPKTTSGFRTVEVAPPLASRLLRLRVERGNPAPSTPLLANLLGRPYDDHNVRRALRGASQRCGLPYNVTPHMLRHTVGSLLYEQGWSDVQVAALLGHKDANFTRRNYLHAVERGDVGILGQVYGIGGDA